MEGSDEVRSRDELLCSVDRTKLPPMPYTILAMANKHVHALCMCVYLLLPRKYPDSFVDFVSGLFPKFLTFLTIDINRLTEGDSGAGDFRHVLKIF